MAKKRDSRRGGSPAAPDKNAEPARTPLAVKTDDNGRIFSHIRQKWLMERPEERVRQAYVVTLHNDYGFGLDQVDEELHVAGRGAEGPAPTWCSGTPTRTKPTPRPR